MQAVDYLLKPFSGRRLALALARARAQLARARPTVSGRLRRLPIDAGGLVRLDRICEIEILRHGEVALRLRDGTGLVSARSYSRQLRAVLALPD